mgnify:FL=1
MINQRVFGTPITGSVRDELDFRQTETTTPSNLSSNVSPFHEGFSLSERTPFIRMWTSIKLMTPADIERTVEKVWF